MNLTGLIGILIAIWIFGSGFLVVILSMASSRFNQGQGREEPLVMDQPRINFREKTVPMGTAR